MSPIHTQLLDNESGERLRTRHEDPTLVHRVPIDESIPMRTDRVIHPDHSRMQTPHAGDRYRWS